MGYQCTLHFRTDDTQRVASSLVARARRSLYVSESHGGWVSVVADELISDRGLDFTDMVSAELGVLGIGFLNADGDEAIIRVTQPGQPREEWTCDRNAIRDEGGQAWTPLQLAERLAALRPGGPPTPKEVRTLATRAGRRYSPADALMEPLLRLTGISARRTNAIEADFRPDSLSAALERRAQNPIVAKYLAEHREHIAAYRLFTYPPAR